MKLFCLQDYLDAIAVADEAERDRLLMMAVEDDRISEAEFGELLDAALPL